jgi:hypothetical protein
MPSWAQTSLSALRARILFFDEPALFACLLDDDEASSFFDHPFVGLVSGHDYERPGVGPYRLVLLPSKEDDLCASPVLALAEVGRALFAERELAGLLLEPLVRFSKGRLVRGGFLCGFHTAHRAQHWLVENAEGVL